MQGIQLSVRNSVATATTVCIAIEGATLVPDGFEAGAGVTNMSILANSVSFAMAPGGSFGVNFSLTLAWDEPTPAITLEGLEFPEDPATVTYWLANGQQVQEVITPGVPLVLTGIAG